MSLGEDSNGMKLAHLLSFVSLNFRPPLGIASNLNVIWGSLDVTPQHHVPTPNVHLP